MRTRRELLNGAFAMSILALTSGYAAAAGEGDLVLRSLEIGVAELTTNGVLPPQWQKWPEI